MFVSGTVLVMRCIDPHDNNDRANEGGSLCRTYPPVSSHRRGAWCFRWVTLDQSSRVANAGTVPRDAPPNRSRGGVGAYERGDFVSQSGRGFALGAASFEWTTLV